MDMMIWVWVWTSIDVSKPTLMTGIVRRCLQLKKMNKHEPCFFSLFSIVVGCRHALYGPNIGGV
jgi:hypothetical protein